MLSLFSSPALACGGLFCNPPPPDMPDSVDVIPAAIEQAGEVVVFGIDEGSQTTTMHVRVDYQGQADDFAWVLPVPAEPDLRRSTPILFEALDDWTTPVLVERREYPGCPWTAFSDADADADADADSDADADVDAPPPPPPTVTIVDSGDVGPFETVTLTATDPADLVEWLQDADYAVPHGLSETLAPYIGDSTHFVALKLQKDEDVGSIEPLALRFPGTEPSIPIQLTAVAATDDMPIEVYVIGEGRGIPLNYLHVQMNPLRWGWGNADRASGMYDEAGGHAFETLFSDEMPAGIARPKDHYALEVLLSAVTADEWLGTLAMNSAWQGVPDDVLLDALQLPAEVDGDLFLACPSCFPELLNPEKWAFDAKGATERLEEAWLSPLLEADAMFTEGARVTRLRTELSPHEMTLDPTFGLRDDLPLVRRTRRLRLIQSCEESIDGSPWNAPYEIVSNGLPYRLDGPTDALLSPSGRSIFEWLSVMGPADALIIEDLATGTVLVDHTDALYDWPGAGSADSERSAGCRTVSAVPLWGGVLLGGMLGIRGRFGSWIWTTKPSRES